MQKKIPNLIKVLRADNVDKLKIILENNVNLKTYATELPSIFDDSPTISAFIAYFGAIECFDYIISLINQRQDEKIFGAKTETHNIFPKVKLNITYADKSSRSTIHFAAAGGKSKFIRRLIEDFNQLADLDSYNRNALHYAAEYNQKKAIDLITSYKKLSIDAKDIFHFTPLHLATDNMCTPVVKCLVDDYHCNVNLRDKDGASPLMFAARVGSLDLFNFLLERNANYKVKSKSELSLLHYSAFGNDSDIIDKLVNELNYTNIDIMDKFKRTPLFYACEKGAYYSAQSFIVQYGAIVNSKDVDDATPIHAAAKSGNSRLFELLINHSTSLNDFTAADKFGRTIIHYAAEVGSVDTITFFLDYISESNKEGQGNDGDPYLFRNLLLQRLTVSGYSALHSAAERNHPYVIELLINKYGLDINQTNVQNETPLHCAAKTNSIESVIILIKLGADLTIKDNESLTALDIAYQLNYTQVIDILEQHGAASSRFASEVPSPALTTPKIEPLNNISQLEPL